MNISSMYEEYLFKANVISFSSYQIMRLMMQVFSVSRKTISYELKFLE